MKTLLDYKNKHYKMIIDFNSQNGVYIVNFPELPGCIAHGETLEKAVENGITVRNEWIETAVEAGWILPEPSVPSKVRGRLTVRIPKYLHKKIVERAEQEDISLNQLILTFIAEGLERITAKEKIEQTVGDMISKMDNLESLIEKRQIEPFTITVPWNFADQSEENIWKSTAKLKEDLARNHNTYFSEATN